MNNKHPICTKDEISEILDRYPQYRECLFARGYLVTDDDTIDPMTYPFYGAWKQYDVCGKRFLVHPFENLYRRDTAERTFVLIGHAYNPFNMKYKEADLLEDCVAEPFSMNKLFHTVNEWTGAFAFFVIENGKTSFFTDATSMKMCNYCSANGYAYVSSHVQLLADLQGYKMRNYTKKIRETKVYNIGLRWMPGLTTAYAEVARLGPNLCAEWEHGEVSIRRFYPYAAHEEVCSEELYAQQVDKICRIMRNEMELCTKKWNRPAISLTGGMDSGATFASTKGFTDQFRIFSFECKEAERKDAVAAEKICGLEAVPFHLYHIPTNEDELADYEAIEKIVNHNTAYVKNLAKEEIRKIAYLKDIHDFDVEAKSDVAEIGRVFYERKYGMKMPDKLHERHLSLMQTRFFFMPLLLRQTDKDYRAYLKATNLLKAPFNYEHSDLVYWEFRIGVSAATTTLSLGMTSELTFPYNNRKLLEMFLAFPHEVRMQDYPQKELMKKMMPEIVQKDVQVEDGYFNQWRIRLERMYFRYKTGLYHPKRG